MNDSWARVHWTIKSQKNTENHEIILALLANRGNILALEDLAFGFVVRFSASKSFVLVCG
jgi:hypothetical protein